MDITGILKKYRPSLSARELERLNIIADMLVSRNEQMNLTAITDEKGVALLHFWDSLTLLDTGLFVKGKKIIDVGCGGGFPSLPLAVCAPECHITANDATVKKLDFVADTASKAGAYNLSTMSGRAEELSRLGEHREKYDIAVSRGVARLNVLCEWCLPFVAVGGHFVAMKGEKGKEEVEEAKNAITVLGGELVDIININVPEYDYAHTLVIIKKTRNTPEEYPRQNGKIKKKPL